MGGWGAEAPYNQYYDVREFEKIRAWGIQDAEFEMLSASMSQKLTDFLQR